MTSEPSRRDFLRTALLTTAAVAAPNWARAQSAGKVRVAVVGHTGRGEFGHGLDAPWRRSADAEIVAVADAGADGEAKARSRFGGARFYTDYRKMFETARPELVLVTPRHADQHLAMAFAAIEAGAKALYIEKPMCRTVGEADTLVAACARAGVVAAVAHRNRYHPALPVVQRLVREGAIGQVLEIRGRGKEDERGGATDLWVLGSHVLNVALCFTGRAVACTGSLSTAGRPATRKDLEEGGDAVGKVAGDEVHARFDTEQGIPIFFDAKKKGRPGQGAGFGLQLIGNEGVIDLRLDETPIAHHLAGNPFRPVAHPRTWTPITTGGLGKPDVMADVARLVSSHEMAARDLMAAWQTHRAPLCSVEDGRIVIAMIMATFESHRRGGARVEFPFAVPDNPLERL